MKRQEARQKFFPKIDVQAVYGPQLDYFGQPITKKNVYEPVLAWSSPCMPGGP